MWTSAERVTANSAGAQSCVPAIPAKLTFRRVVAPRVRSPVRAPSRVFPLELRGQTLARPATVLTRVVPGDAVDRMVALVRLSPVAEVAGLRCPAGPCMHASSIGRDSHFCPVHFETVDGHLMREPGRRVATEPLCGNRARDECTARNANHEVGLGMMCRVFQASATTEGLRWRRRLFFWDDSTRTLLHEATRQNQQRRSTQDQQPRKQVPPHDEPRTRERSETQAATPFLRSLVRATAGNDLSSAPEHRDYPGAREMRCTSRAPRTAACGLGSLMPRPRVPRRSPRSLRTVREPTTP